MRRRRRIRVPASSANLGPGFDVLAAALAMHIEVEVVETGRFGVVTDLSIARDRRNLVVRGFARLAQPDDFEFRITSDVPPSMVLARLRRNFCWMGPCQSRSTVAAPCPYPRYRSPSGPRKSMHHS